MVPVAAWESLVAAETASEMLVKKLVVKKHVAKVLAGNGHVGTRERTPADFVGGWEGVGRRG